MKKWFKRIGLTLAVLVLAGWALSGWLVRQWTAKPPPLPADTSVLKLTPQARDDKVWLGKSWFGHRDGLMVVYLKGSPLEMGYADGVLLQKQVHTLEDDFITMIHGYVHQDWKINLLKNYVIYRNRHLSDFISADYRLEIYGSTLGCPDTHPEIGNYYNRVLNYHAAHDISYMMIDNPLVARAGCTSFGAWGGATQKGHLITGRNFDWEAAEVFSRDRVVMMCEPDGGIPFISLSWAGMTGVVSGMNRAGVSVTINGAPSSLPDDTATPIAIVARDVLQRAHNMKEALEIVRSAHVFVSSLWLVGSRADGCFVVVEKTPAKTQVRQSDGDWIACANHFQTTGLCDSPRNIAYTNEATSLPREARMSELIRQDRGNLTPEDAVRFLRDRRLPGGASPGNGHRATLNAFIATHSTVMDLTDGIFWAASPPNQFGKFIAFDVQEFSHELPERAVAADEIVASGEYERTRQSQRALTEGFHALKEKKAQDALDDAVEAESLNPGFYQNSMLRGRALLDLGRNDEAGLAFKTALAENPAFLKEKIDLEALLKQSQEKR